MCLYLNILYGAILLSSAAGNFKTKLGHYKNHNLLVFLDQQPVHQATKCHFVKATFIIGFHTTQGLFMWPATRVKRMDWSWPMFQLLKSSIKFSGLLMV